MMIAAMTTACAVRFCSRPAGIVEEKTERSSMASLSMRPSQPLGRRTFESSFRRRDGAILFTRPSDDFLKDYAERLTRILNCS